MVDSIRIKLALWFVCMVMLLYSIDSIASMMVFKMSLMRSVDVGLEDLIAEIRPSVKIVNGVPSLKDWYREAKGQALLATVQIFNQSGKAIEEHGPEGVQDLHNGSIRLRGMDKSLRSMYSKVEYEHVPCGFIQLQVSTEPQDEAIEQFFLVVMVVAPFIAAGVGICAYLFSGQAVKPIERTLVMLRRFVADAGHELNTPVATIEACLETLKDPNKDGGMSDQDLFKMMERSSERLRHLAKDLIVLARIEDPEAELMRSNINLKEVAEAVVAELMPIARERDIKIVLKPSSDIFLSAHSESILEIFNNLIDNAIKYSESKGEVNVSLEHKDSHIMIVVSDQGVGIPKDSLLNIFDRFYRVDRSRSRDVGGSGLGLSIVKAAVERHSGAVTVESEPNKGTTFRVSLPAS